MPRPAAACGGRPRLSEDNGELRLDSNVLSFALLSSLLQMVKVRGCHSVGLHPWSAPHLDALRPCCTARPAADTV